MMAENGMTGVTVKKDELIAALKKNRESHRSLFLEAQNGYREQAIKELDAMLAEARRNEPIRRQVTLVEPQDHTKDYDRALRMLTMSVSDTVFISEQEFACYVEDDWGWKNAFVAQTSNYSKR
jgi:hypothetical protein